MTNDPKQAKTILGWLPQSPLASPPAAQPAESAAPAPDAAQPSAGYPQAGYAAPAAALPAQPSAPGYLGAAPGYPGAQVPGYPAAQPHASGYPAAQPQASGYPAAQPQSPGYPGVQPQSSGYPAAQPQSPGYPAQPQSPGYPAAQPQASGYPAAQPQSPSYPGAQPHAPGYYGAQPQSSGYPGAQPQSSGFPGAQLQSSGFPGAQPQSSGYPGAQPHAPGFGGSSDAGQPVQHAHGYASPGAASNVHGIGGFAGGGAAQASSGSAGSRDSLRERANATEGVSDRTRFIRLTYAHLLGAILVFAGLEYLLMTNPFLIETVSAPFVRFAIGGRWNWGIVLAAFMAVSWVADYWASHTTSRSLQYVGLGFYVVAEAVIFVPLLAIVQWKTAAIIARGGGDPNIIRDAAFTTLAIFGALTASVFVTKKDFSFLRTGLMMASAAAMMLVILSLVFGFNLGIVFSIAMVLLAAGYILFQTSQILAHYDPRNHVAAALALFSSVALMFWYVIRIFMRMRE